MAIAPRGLAPVLVALALAAPAALSQDADPNQVYEFETVMAPVCLDGEFPLRLELIGGYHEGTLTITTSDRGRLSGSYEVDGTTLEVSGTVKYRPDGHTVKMTAKEGANRLTFRGTLENGDFAGVVTGKGPLAPGNNTFTMTLSSAGPTVATVAVVFPPDAAEKASGEGTLDVCGPRRTIAASRTASTGKGFRLSLRSGAWRWTGEGTWTGGGGPVTVSWTAKGFGAQVSGAGLGLSLVAPPAIVAYADPDPFLEAEEVAAANGPTLSGGPARTWTVDPALPTGLVLDPDTGVIAGTPALPAAAATYTVTAANLAGSDSYGIDLSIRGNRAYSFAVEQRTLTDADYRHFLVRTHFGVKGLELASLKAAGIDAYLDDALTMQSGTALETAAFQELVNADDPPGYEGMFPNGNQLSRYWVRMMVDTDRPMQEALAFFWHDHMPVAWDVLGGGYTHFMTNHIDLYRHSATGNFRDFLLAMARDPAMLIYLSGYQNNRFAPNENFAREFWELFTLGVDNGYTQDDIVQAAKAFTGWRLRYNDVTGLYYFEFSTSLHDTGSKTFFGATIPGQNVTDDYAAVVDISLANRPVAEFLTRKIFEYFCYEDPPQALVDTMAASLRDGNWELKPFFKDLFRSEAFFSSRSRAPRVKGALEYEIGLVRSTGLKLTVGLTDSYLNLLGHRPGLPPTVNGWPLGTLWYSADAMVNRTNMAYSMVGDTARQRNNGIEVAAILPPVAERTDDAVLDTLEGLLRVSLTDAERTALLDYLNTTRATNGTISPSPFDGSSQAQLDERVRGLIYILAQHPSFHVK